MPHLSVGRQAYCAGFLLDDQGRVVLIRKARPAWQAGKLNAVGGHVEDGESTAAAMRREFTEEAGLDLPDWQHIATVTFPAGAVWFFRLHTDAATLDQAHTCTDETIAAHHIKDLLPAATGTVQNLTWLLPLALYRGDQYAPLLAHETA